MPEAITDQIGGYQILINSTVTYRTVKRTWKERLFALPWQPMTKFKSVPNGYLMQDDEVYGLIEERKIICNPNTAKRIKEEIKNPWDTYGFCGDKIWIP